MSEEQVWELRMLFNSVAELQRSVVTMIATERLSEKDARDFRLNAAALIDRMDGILEMRAA